MKRILCVSGRCHRGRPAADRLGSNLSSRPRRMAVGAVLASSMLAAVGAPAANAATQPAGPVAEQVQYGPKLHERADIYSGLTPGATTVVLVHGGGWRFDRGLVSVRRESVALQAQGFAVFNVDYAVDSAKTPAFPLEPDNLEEAVRFAIAHAAQYNANPHNVVLLGGSAGGNLVALAAEQLDQAAPGTVRAVVSLSGPMNFETLVPMIEAGEVTNLNFTTSVYQAIGGEEEGEEEEGPTFSAALMLEGSPALNVHSNGCPAWLLFNSEHELVPLPQAQEMYGVLSAAGCQASLQVVPGKQHAFEYWNKVSPQIMSFIASE